MSKPLTFAKDAETYSQVFAKPASQPHHAFHGVCTDTRSAPVSIELTDAGLLAEPWEAIEIDEAHQPMVAVAGSSGLDLLAGRCPIKPYRHLLARFARRHGLRLA